MSIVKILPNAVTVKRRDGDDFTEINIGVRHAGDSWVTVRQFQEYDGDGAVWSEPSARIMVRYIHPEDVDLIVAVMDVVAQKIKELDERTGKPVEELEKEVSNASSN